MNRLLFFVALSLVAAGCSDGDSPKVPTGDAAFAFDALRDGGLQAEIGADLERVACADRDVEVAAAAALASVAARMDGREIVIVTLPTGERAPSLEILGADGARRVGPVVTAGLPEAPSSTFIKSNSVDLDVSSGGYAVAWQTWERADDKVFTGPEYGSSSAAVFGRNGQQLMASSTRSVALDVRGFRVDTAYPRVHWAGNDVWFAWSDKRVRERVTGQVRQKAGIYGRRLAPNAQSAGKDQMLIDYAQSLGPFHLDADGSRVAAAWIAGGSDLQPYVGNLPALGADPVPKLRLMAAKAALLAENGAVYGIFGESYAKGTLQLVRRNPDETVVVKPVTISSGMAERVTVQAVSVGDAIWIAWATNDASSDSQEVGWGQADDPATHTSIRVGPQNNLQLKLLDLQVLGDQVSVLVSRGHASGQTSVKLHQRCLR